MVAPEIHPHRSCRQGPPDTAAASMDHKAAKRVAIVGAGTSGLAASKHLLARGFRPVVFEAGAAVGGLWTRTLATTRLQSPNQGYRFSDFPWPEDADAFPRHDQVVAYLAAYARRFGVEDCVRFRSKVVAAEFVGTDDGANAELWAGNGEAFGGDGAGRWRLTVRHGDSDATQTYEFDFLILCIGRFSGVPNIPEFPPGVGPDAFRGRVLHSMDFSDMNDADAAALVRGKRVAVVGSGKSAFDIAAECADANGAERPCTMVCRSPQWLLHDVNVWGKLNLGYLYMNRFAQLMVRKPGAGLASTLLATLLTPLVRKTHEPQKRKCIQRLACSLHSTFSAGVADIEGDGGILQEGDTDAGARHGAGARVRRVHLVVQHRHAARRVLRQGEGRQHRHQAVRGVQLLRGRPGAGRRRPARRPRRPGDTRHRVPRRSEAQGHVRVAPGEGHRRRLVGHHRPSLQGVRAPTDPADGGDRVLGEPDQHLLDRDDGQVGGAVPGRRVPAAGRGADGAERGGVGRVHATEQRGEVPAVVPRRREHLVQRRAVPRHGLRPKEEEGAPRRVVPALRRRRLRRYPVTLFSAASAVRRHVGGVEHRWIKRFLADWLLRYGPADYAEIKQIEISSGPGPLDKSYAIVNQIQKVSSPYENA
ncbi:uncharacterized protein [Setaria viridis]|nr:uncharacterized protein LOC117843159 isoform X1 [Setaria viridis]